MDARTVGLAEESPDVRVRYDGLVNHTEAGVGIRGPELDVETRIPMPGSYQARNAGDSAAQAIGGISEKLAELGQGGGNGQTVNTSFLADLFGGGEGDKGGGGSTNYDDQLQRYRDYLQGKVEALRQSLMTEREAELERYQLAQEDLKEALELEMITKQEYDELKRKNHQEHLERIDEMERRSAKNRMRQQQKVADFEKSTRAYIVNQAIGLLGKLGSKNKAFALAAIALTKARAIAETIANTQSASVLAYASQLVPGDPSSIARASAAALKTQSMGAAKVGVIAATGLIEAAGVISSGGGLSGGSVSTGGGTTSASIGGSAPAQQPQQQAPAGGTLTVQGISASSIFSGDAVRELAEELLEFQKRGGQVLIT